MKIYDLPEDYKQYTIILSTGYEYKIDGKMKKNILASKTNFIELPSGSTINKAFIVEFRLDLEATKDCVSKNKNKLLNP